MRTLGVYKSYNFRDKDPVIDIVRRIVDLYAAEHNLSVRAAMRQISERSGVSYAAMTNWFYGTVRRPQFATVQAVVRACGSNFTVSRDTPRRGLQIVRGDKNVA